MNPPNQFPCPLCGGKSFLWGEAAAHEAARNHALCFRRGAKRLGLDTYWQQNDAMSARVCQGCRNVQLFLLDEA